MISEKILTEVEVNASVILCCVSVPAQEDNLNTLGLTHMSDLSILDSTLKKCT